MSKDPFRLDGRSVFLSGAAGHLGRAMSWALARAGAHVILNGRTESTLRALQAELAAQGHGSTVAAFDITDRKKTASFLKGLARLDVLVNNAITGLPGKECDGGSEAFEKALHSGITVAYQNVEDARSALEAAVDAAGMASVVNITSVYSHVSPTFGIYGASGLDSPPYYSAAKGGLLQLTRYMACRLAKSRIRVNSLSPGIFPWAEVQRSHPAFIDAVSGRTPVGRPGRAEEIGGPIVFLASDASSYMTGADLIIDGGWTAQ